MWCRECKTQTDIVHFHCAIAFAGRVSHGARFLRTEAALFQLVGRLGGGMLGEFAVKITLQSLRVEGFLKFSPAPEYAIRAARHPKQLRAAKPKS